jgi:hypothetical protein
MQLLQKIMLALVLSFTSIFISADQIKTLNDTSPLKGAWVYNNNIEQQVMLFADGYFNHTAYNTNNGTFNYTRGGTYQIQDNQLLVFTEFDTRNKELIGDTVKHLIAISGNELSIHLNKVKFTFKREDDTKDNLAGLWKISARKQGEGIVPIHQTGTRKTVKILTGTRFQWAAINPATKEFSGTGGGRYTFKNGKYTEHIEFFSRDSSRVGASLSFDGKVQDGDWHHSGLSSKGEPIYEVWSRVK